MIAGRKLAHFFTDKGQFFRPIKDRRSWTWVGWKEKGSFVVKLYIIFLIPIFYWFFFVLRTLVISLAATKICFLAKKSESDHRPECKKGPRKGPAMLRFFVNLHKKWPIFAAGLSTFWLVEREKIFVPLLNHMLYFSTVYHLKTSFVVLRTLFLFLEATKACSLIKKTNWSLNRTTKRTRDAALFCEPTKKMANFWWSQDP